MRYNTAQHVSRQAKKDVPTRACASTNAGLMRAVTTVFLCKISGYLPSETVLDGVAAVFGTSSMASVGLVLACVVQTYTWLQWATLIGAEAMTALHTSAHTLVTTTHKTCPPEEENPAGSQTANASVRGRVELRSVTLVRGSTTVLRNASMQVMYVCACMCVCDMRRCANVTVARGSARNLQHVCSSEHRHLFVPRRSMRETR
jgi:hypothetical protein